jgi:hypothetical protein
VRQDLGGDVEVVCIYQPNARNFGEVDRLKCFDLVLSVSGMKAG